MGSFSAQNILNVHYVYRACCAALFLAELYWGYRIGIKIATWRQVAANFLTGLTLTFLAKPALIFLYQPFWNFFSGHHLMLSAWNNSFGTFFIAVLAMDFTYYCAHRLMHSSSFVWIFHSMHHSDEHVNVSTGYRISLTGSTFFLYFPLLILGFPSDIFWASLTVVSIYPLWLHSRFIPKIPGVEWLVFTPSGHRVHHGFNEQYRNKNFGGVFTVFDRALGTYEPENDKPVFFNSKLSTDNVWKMQTQSIAAFYKIQKNKWQRNKKGEVKATPSGKVA